MNLAANHIPNVHQKYVWFADYFNQTLKKIYGNQKRESWVTSFCDKWSGRSGSIFTESAKSAAILFSSSVVMILAPASLR